MDGYGTIIYNDILKDEGRSPLTIELYPDDGDHHYEPADTIPLSIEDCSDLNDVEKKVRRLIAEKHPENSKFIIQLERRNEGIVYFAFVTDET